MSLDDAIRSRCSDQHGVISLDQLRAISPDSRFRQVRVRNGMLRKTGDRTYVLAGSSRSDAQQLMATILETGGSAILSHQSAARWWGLPGFPLRPIHVSIERSRRWRQVPHARVHHATLIPRDHRCVLRGIPVASPALTLFMLAGVLHPDHLERAVDQALSKRLVGIPTLDDTLDRLAQQGRNGIVAMRRILEARREGWTPPQSNLEGRFHQLMLRNGLGLFRTQVDVGDAEWTGRVDFLAVHLPLVVEIQSERYHTALSDTRKDEARRAKLEEAGFSVLEIWDDDLFLDPQRVVCRVEREVRRLALDRSRPEVGAQAPPRVLATGERVNDALSGDKNPLRRRRSPG